MIFRWAVILNEKLIESKVMRNFFIEEDLYFLFKPTNNQGFIKQKRFKLMGLNLFCFANMENTIVLMLKQKELNN
jgi:hypothetical protein